MKYISIRQQQNISYYGIFDNSLAQYIINIQLMFRRASEMYISSTIASRSISAAEDLPGNFFVSKNRYFMVNHQYFGGVEKKFVIHRASPRDMRTKRELGARRRGRECRNHRRRLAIFFPQTFTSCKFIIGSSSDWNKKICHERKKTRGGGVF